VEEEGAEEAEAAGEAGTQEETERSAGAAAEDEESSGANLTRSYRPEGEPLEERRERVDVDSLPEEGPSPGEVLLWVPRGLFFPVYLTTNYLIRWPVGKLFTAIERYHVAERLLAALTFAGGDAGVFPLFQIGGNRASSVGVRFFYDEIVDDRLDLDLGFEGLPDRNATGTFDLTFYPSGTDGFSRFDFRFAGEHRDDFFFYGVGLQPDGRDERFFTQRTLFTQLAWIFGGNSGPGEGEIRVRLADRKVSCSEDLSEDVCGDDHRFGTGDDIFLPIETEGVAELREDSTFAAVGTEFYVDSRDAVPGSGVRLQGHAEVGEAFDEDLNAFRAGGELAGYLEIPGAYKRVVGTRFRAESAAPFDGAEIPVGELVSYGGVELMRGFDDKRFRGRSLLLATVNYRYPVWSFFDGKVFAEAAQLTGDYWDSFELDDTRASFGIGLRTKELRSSDQNSYALNVAVGTSKFRNGFSVEQFRLNLGTNWGF